MGNPYQRFIVDYFQLLETDSVHEEKMEALVSRDDSPVKAGIDTATGQITVATDPRFLNYPKGPEAKRFAGLILAALEETARNRLNKQISLAD